MKTQDWLILGAAALLLFFLLNKRAGAGAGAGASTGGGTGVQVDPWSQRIDSSVGALESLYNIGKDLFGSSSSSSDETTYA